MTRFLALLLVAALWGGCSLGDCSFDVSTAETTGGLLLADGRTVGDTLTVAFVNAYAPDLALRVEASAETGSDRSPDQVVEILYDATSRTISGERLATPLVTTTVGSTVYVYFDGTVDPARFVCSPPPLSFDLTVREVLPPAGVAATRVVAIDVNDLPAPAMAALRQASEDRRLTRTISS